MGTVGTYARSTLRLRRSERARRGTKRWTSTQRLTVELAKQIEEYALNVHDDSSNQTKEELARQREMSDAVAKEYQFVAPTEYNDVAERTGVVMHSVTFLSKLQNNGVICWFAKHPQAGKVTLVYINKLSKKPEVGCWLQSGQHARVEHHELRRPRCTSG